LPKTDRRCVCREASLTYRNLSGTQRITPTANRRWEAEPREQGQITSANLWEDLNCRKKRPAHCKSPEQLAELLRIFAREGVNHSQPWLGANTMAGIDTFTPVLELLDRE
jgi:hypothetical protein